MSDFGSEHNRQGMPILRFLPIFLIAVLLGFRLDANAQSGSEGIVLETRFQMGAYSGERGLTGYSGLERVIQSLSPGVSLGVGYGFSRRLEAMFEWSTGTYPGIMTRYAEHPPVFTSISSDRRSAISADVRYSPFQLGPLKPFLSFGGGLVRGKINDETRTAGGPQLGGGLILPVGSMDIIGFARNMFTYPSDALDHADETREPDFLSALALGVRYRFREKVPELGDIIASGPSSIAEGMEGVFSIQTDLDPVEYTVSWVFGDGSRATGHSVRYAYSDPGDYTITALVSNARESSTVSMEIVVEETFSPVSIVSVANTPSSPRVGQTVAFVPTIRGAEYVCAWRFGDGSSSDLCEATHEYSQPGGFRVTLTVSNPEHSSHFSQSLVVQSDACAELPPLAAVYFTRHSDELSLEMRQILRSNMSAASACSDRLIEVVGYAIDNERNAEDLAERRTSAVIQYYLNLGMSTSKVRSGVAKVYPVSELEQLPWMSRNAQSLLINPNY